jgi:hypothetical protein
MPDANDQDSISFLTVTDYVFSGTKAKHEIPIIHQIVDGYPGAWVFLQDFHAFNDSFGRTLCSTGIPGFDKFSEAINVSDGIRQPDYFTGHGFS